MRKNRVANSTKFQFKKKSFLDLTEIFILEY